MMARVGSAPPASSTSGKAGEYNVARGLRRCFGLRTAVVTALADNDIGRLVEDLMLQGLLVRLMVGSIVSQAREVPCETKPV